MIKSNYNIRTEKMIINLLKKGKSNAVTRKELIDATGYSDRKVRKEIEILRHRGHLIASDIVTGGYYLVETKIEANDYFLTELKKYSTCYKNINKLKNNINNAFSMQLLLDFD